MNKYASGVFTFLMRLVYPEFRFPGGKVARDAVQQCLETLEKQYISVSRERVMDFCICQVYAISRYGDDYRRRWNVSHSFGRKALERYSKEKEGGRYYENRWLKEHGLSRKRLLSLFADRTKHPLFKFIYPEWEECTKKRLLDMDAGYYICQVSTMLWTPFSPSCRVCSFATKCKDVTARKYHELYRLRIMEYQERSEDHGKQ